MSRSRRRFLSVRGEPTGMENAQKRPRDGGRVSHTLPLHRPHHQKETS